MEVTTVVARVSPPLFIFLVRFPSSFLHSSLPTFFFSPSFSSFSPSSFLVFLVVVVFVVVGVTVDPLFFLFTMHRSTGTLPPCQQTNAGKKRRKRWKRTTGFFHTQTSASSSSQTARLFLASVTELQSRRRNEAIVKIHCELWPDFYLLENTRASQRRPRAVSSRMNFFLLCPCLFFFFLYATMNSLHKRQYYIVFQNFPILISN